jgi:hypothetical protein
MEAVARGKGLMAAVTRLRGEREAGRRGWGRERGGEMMDDPNNIVH